MSARARAEIPERYRWDLSAIFPDLESWQRAFDDLSRGIDAFPAFKGTLAQGADRLLEALQANDALDQLAYKVWYYPALQYDEDQRDNAVNARRQQVQILFARWRQASSWFSPEVLAIPIDTVRMWMASNEGLAVYRFAIENLFRQQEHVLDEAGERLLSLASRFSGSPSEAYAALSTADAKFPTIRLSTGEEVTVTYAEYRAILATRRAQADRAAAYRAHHSLYVAALNTYAALYNAVVQRDWFLAQARGYGSTLDAALHGNNIPPSVVHTLIDTTREGVAPLRRYHALRKARLRVADYHVYDFSIPLVAIEEKYPYDVVVQAIGEAVAPLGPEYQARMRRALEGRYIDVYENEGKRAGAYSAPVYGVHPYVLMNYNDTLGAAFTLAHEMGHSLHTILAHEQQPFVYSGYTIFVAEVPSTLTEALFLEYMLARAPDPRERVLLLQHAIDAITGTFYTQVLFADFELRAHRLVEEGRAITADVLAALYHELLDAYYGDTIARDDLTGATWARIPHFYGSPYYVYQYATCFASAAQLGAQIMEGPEGARRDAVERYLGLLRSGGNDYPMAQLARAGVDLTQVETVRAVVRQLDRLVDRLEEELHRLD